ncbi:hypothetical protein FXB39_13785 [Nocardioides sp. BGMRC 2183]|nr:hypothetical protein FXB39_13785 [Nocardioides sp. BGMRC 2183]
MAVIAATAVGLTLAAAGPGGAEPPTTDREVQVAKPAPSPATTLAAQFKSPPMSARPSYRFWHPGGRIDPDTLRQEFRAMVAGGAGGVELMNFVRDNSVAPIEDYDPARHGIGTPAWQERFTDAYRIGEDAGLQVDTTYTSKYSANLSTVTPDEPGSDKILSLTTAWLSGAETYDAALTEPTLPARVSVADLIDVRAYPCIDACEGDVPVLDPTDSVDLTDQVREGHHLTWSAPAGERRWAVIASWMHGTGHIVEGVETTGTGTLVDHFDDTGIDAVIDFWNDRILDGDLRETLADSGGSLFFDSLELNIDGVPPRHWTGDFIEEFEKRRGYDVTPYLAALAVDQPEFDLPGKLGTRVREDYLSTLNDLFVDEHLLPLRDFAHSLGLTLRGQPYSSWGGTFLDPMEAWSVLDIPEGEDRSFGAGANQGLVEMQGIDAWRSMASTAQASGHTLVSSECCASFGRAYRIPRQKLLSHINQNFAGGVNNIVLHGWSHNAPGIAGTWPGWAGFGNTGVDDSYGPQNPTWSDDKRINKYIARLQVALRAGTPRTDIAIYHQEAGHSPQGTVGERYFKSTALESKGYSYGYLNTTLIDRVTAKNGVLAPAGARYRAFVIDNEQAMPLATAQKIVRYVEAGVPLVVVGPAPTRSNGKDTSDDKAVRATFRKLQRYGHVRYVRSEGDVRRALQSLRVRPHAAFTGRSTLTGVHRQLKDADVYYWYNASEAREDAAVSVAARGIPYRLDPWTGALTPIGDYVTRGRRTSLSLDVAGGDAALVVLSRKPLGKAVAPRSAVVSTNASDVVVEDGRAVLRSDRGGRLKATLANGRKVRRMVAAVPSPIALERWRLSVQSWHRGDTLRDVAKTDLPEVDVTASEDGKLPAWSALDGLELVSGVGTYTTTVKLGRDWNGKRGAYLDLGGVTTTYQVVVNGERVRSADQLDARVDIGDHLRRGANTITVTVASMLGNAVNNSTKEHYGLTGPVALTPYVDAPIGRRGS